LRDLTLVGQTNNKERNKQKEKTNPTKSKNKSHKKKQIPQTEMPSPLHSIVRSEIDSSSKFFMFLMTTVVHNWFEGRNGIGQAPIREVRGAKPYNFGGFLQIWPETQVRAQT